MFSLPPLTRRITYVVSFEALAILLGTLLLSALSGEAAHANFVITAIASSVAVLWNFVYNTIFETWERRFKSSQRTVKVRIAHTLGFEGGLVAALIPLFMWWYQVDVITALKMEISLLLFFLVFTFIFTWIFDRIVLNREIDG